MFLHSKSASMQSKSARTAGTLFRVIAAAWIGAASSLAGAQTKPLQGQQIVLYTSGGTQLETTRELVIKPFEAESGAKVIVDDTCCARMQPALEAGQYIGDLVIGLDRSSLLARADRGMLLADPRVEQIARRRGVADPFPSSQLVVLNQYSFLIAAKNDTVPLPKTWAEFFDVKKFPGTRGLLRNSPHVQLEAALLADGVSSERLYPLDVDRAFRKLDQLRASTKIVVSASGADQINNLGTGEVTYGITYSNRAFLAQRDGIKINFGYDDGFVVGNAAALLKGAKNVDGAVALLEYHMRPEVLAKFAERTGMGPSYKAAADLVDDKLKQKLPTSVANLARQHRLSDEYWQANQVELNKRWLAWLAQ